MPKLINIVLYSQRLFIYHWTEAKDYVHFCVHFQQHELRNLNNASSLFKNILFRLFDVWSLRLSLLDFPTRGNWKLNVSLLQLILNWDDRVVKTTRKCFSLVPKQLLSNVQVSCILINNREGSLCELNPQFGQWHPRRSTETKLSNLFSYQQPTRCCFVHKDIIIFVSFACIEFGTDLFAYHRLLLIVSTSSFKLSLFWKPDRYFV